VLGRYGYGEIRTPVFEHAELFRRPLGFGSDVVAKEMYEFEDKGGRNLALRPEGTASVVRAYIEHGLYAKGSRHKLFYIGPIFRYDRPQAGRYREHYQVGIEVFGDPSPYMDAEIMELGTAVLCTLGVCGYERRVNSNGCPGCRPRYEAALRDFLIPKKERLCRDCSGYRLENNVLRVLDCKDASCRMETAAAPAMAEMLCEECASHHRAVLGHLKAMGLSFVSDPRLVRGFDYYTRTVFEFVGTDADAEAGKGVQLLGGGRYDGLVGLLGGPATPAAGWGMGLERAMNVSAIEASCLSPSVYVAAAAPEAFGRAVRICRGLRDKGLRCELGQEGKSLNSQMRAAGASGAAFAVLVAEGSADVGVKDLRTGVQDQVSESDLFRSLADRASGGRREET
jgi:histidyl-tRNA synthetase